jgi:hypothetical protein
LAIDRTTMRSLCLSDHIIYAAYSSQASEAKYNTCKIYSIAAQLLLFFIFNLFIDKLLKGNLKGVQLFSYTRTPQTKLKQVFSLVETPRSLLRKVNCLLAAITVKFSIWLEASNYLQPRLLAFIHFPMLSSYKH